MLSRAISYLCWIRSLAAKLNALLNARSAVLHTSGLFKQEFQLLQLCTCGTRLVWFAIYCCVLHYIQKVWHSLKSAFIENSFCSSQHEQRFIGDLRLTRYACQILTCNVLTKLIYPCGHGCFSVTTFRCAHCLDQNKEFSQRRVPQKSSLLGHATGRGKKKNLQRKLTHVKNVW